MLYYDRIDISEGIDHTKSNNSKEFMNCYYCFFLSWIQISSSCM